MISKLVSWSHLWNRAALVISFQIADCRQSEVKDTWPMLQVLFSYLTLCYFRHLQKCAYVKQYAELNLSVRTLLYYRSSGDLCLLQE